VDALKILRKAELHVVILLPPPAISLINAMELATVTPNGNLLLPSAMI